MEGGGLGRIEKEKLTKIKNLLKTSNIALEQELILNANHNLFFGEYRLAVIESEIAFEVFIDNFITYLYKKSGKTELEIKDIMKTGLKNLLNDHIKKLTNYDFVNSEEYKEWNEKAYQKRNKIIHGGITPTRDEAKKSIEVIVKTINHLGIIGQKNTK